MGLDNPSRIIWPFKSPPRLPVGGGDPEYRRFYREQSSVSRHNALAAIVLVVLFLALAGVAVFAFNENLKRT